MKPWAGVFIMLLIPCSSGWCGWTNSMVWNYGNTAYRIKVGDVRMDGHQRMYCGTRDGSVNELSYEQGSWVNRLIDVLPGKALDVAIAKGRNDTIPRLYVPCASGHLYELSYEGGIWTRMDMGGSSSGEMNQVALGRGRNDTIVRAYATNTDGHVYEFTWDQGSWNQSDLGNIGGWMIDLAVGKTAHDSLVHVYTSSQSGGIYELTYTNGWSSSLMDMLSPAPWGMEIGVSAKGSPLLPLYVTSEGERDVWMYCWVGGGWQKTSIGHPGQSTLYGSDIALGNGRNDGVERVYQINKDAHAYEFSYEGGQWQTEDLGDGGYGWATGITVGRGRDDTLNHVYTCYPDGKVTEYSYSTGVSEEPSSGPPYAQGRLEAYPNPFNSFATLPGHSSELFALYDIFGSRVGVFKGDRIGEGLAAGVYFLKAEKGDQKPIRIVKVR